jgi:hypothetical protein
MRMKTRKRSAERAAMEQEAFGRAVSGMTMSNYPAIIAGFVEKGIAEADICPRENVFTYHAWRALGRQVRRGEHGIKVLTYVTVKDRDSKEDVDGIATTDIDGTDKPESRGYRKGYRRPWTATVFHVSQTEPVESAERTVGPLAKAGICAGCGATVPNTWSDPRGYVQVDGKVFCSAECEAK